MWKCPICGYVNEDSEDTCRDCLFNQDLEDESLMED